MPKRLACGLKRCVWVVRGIKNAALAILAANYGDVAVRFQTGTCFSRQFGGAKSEVVQGSANNR